MLSQPPASTKKALSSRIRAHKRSGLVQFMYLNRGLTGTFTAGQYKPTTCAAAQDCASRTGHKGGYAQILGD